MRAASSPRLLVLALVAVGAALTGCGKSGVVPSADQPAGAIPPVSAQGAVGLATKNTTRLGGADPASDAAAVARAVYPGFTTATRPQAVVLVDEHDWPGSLAASILAGAPLGAPLLYAKGDTLPDSSLQALRAMRPTGAPALGGAQVIRIGTSVAVPGEFRTRTVARAGGGPAMAAAIEQLSELARGGAAGQVIVLAADAPLALQMPAAGLAAESGAPILFVNVGAVPAVTAAALTRLRRPAIYVVGPSAVGAQAQATLARFGHVTPILDGSTPPEVDSPVENANAVARFTDGRFGWGVKEPGHGLVFANAGRPFDAPACALLSASGNYAPLLLLESSRAVPSAVASYLSDIQPAYGSAPQFQPVHGAYNHGWLIGDERAISAPTQAEIDSMLEISPRRASAEEEPPASPAE